MGDDDAKAFIAVLSKKLLYKRVLRTCRRVADYGNNNHPIETHAAVTFILRFIIMRLDDAQDKSQRCSMSVRQRTETKSIALYCVWVIE
jgi:hypothetical protein